MSHERTNFLVGLFTLLGVIALAVLSLRVASHSIFSFSPTYSLIASFDNVGSLKTKAQVKSSGVTVGKVFDIVFDNQSFQALVTLHIEKKYRFPKDSSASILTFGLLGDQYVNILAGCEEEYLSGGENIHYTQSAVLLENLISKFLYGASIPSAYND